MNNEPKTIKLTGVFPKTFRVSKCESGRNDCNFEYTDEKKQVFFEVCLHGAVSLHEHFTELGYTELAPKVEFPTWPLTYVKKESVRNSIKKLTGRKTLTHYDIEALKELGFVLVLEQATERI